VGATAGTQIGTEPIVTRSVDVPRSVAAEPGKVEICGQGNVVIDDPGAFTQYVGALTKKAGARWLAALQDSGDLRARVAGPLL
jgi:hypothetical protein